MEFHGLRASNNPKAMLSCLLTKRDKLQDELRSVEKQAEELRVGKEDGKLDTIQGRLRVGGLATGGQGKPKKGQIGQREVKRMRLSSDVDPDDEDEHDLR